MSNNLDLFLKEIGLHLSPLQKKIIKKPLRKKNRYVLYILDNMVETYSKILLNSIRRI